MHVPCLSPRSHHEHYAQPKYSCHIDGRWGRYRTSEQTLCKMGPMRNIEIRINRSCITAILPTTEGPVRLRQTSRPDSLNTTTCGEMGIDKSLHGTGQKFLSAGLSKGRVFRGSQHPQTGACIDLTNPPRSSTVLPGEGPPTLSQPHGVFGQ